MLASYTDLPGKTVIVTGANGGMGLAIVHALAKSGASVLASDIQPEPNDVIRDLNDVRYVQADIGIASEVESVVNQAVALNGQLDCAVNAAALEFETERLHDCDIADFDRLMSVNLRGLFLCMKYELRAMITGSAAGSIVNLASTTSIQPGTLQPVYSASKHGVLGLTKQAALDYAGDKIRVNAIAPGNIDTPMFQRALTRREIDPARVERSMPLGRLGHVREIAEATLWLCSDASSFTTGHTLAVEGGMLVG